MKKLYILLITLCSIFPIQGKTDTEKKIVFSYQDADLVDVINYISSEKNVNVVLPMRAADKISAKLTWSLEKKIPISKAWELLGTFLSIAGYSIVPHNEKENDLSTYYEIVKNSKDISSEPMPIYIGTNPVDLPSTEQRIRYVYYLANIKLDASGEEKESEISQVIKTLMPPETAGTVFKLDPSSNALIIMGQSNDIKATMKVITHIDRPGFQEQMEIIKLTNTEAKNVANLFNSKILQSNEINNYRLDAKKPSEAVYFSKFVKIIANDRTNSLIILGRQQSIDRIKNFIYNYIDVKPESGQSILHVYQLQYLDAPQFANVLRNIVEGKKTGGEGEAQSTGDKKTAVGPTRYFEDVLISVDTPEELQTKKEEVDNGFGTNEVPANAGKYYGGNKLIIAARSDDWKRLLQLIESLDIPSPTVLMEILIADLTLDDERALGSMFRNPAKIPLPNQMNVQSAQLRPGVIPNAFTSATDPLSPEPKTIGVIESAGIAADTLRYFTQNPDTGVRTDATGADADAQTVASYAAAGSTIVSFNDNDGKTWGITRILKTLDNTKILSHPHIIGTNNKAATIKNAESRLVKGDASASSSAVVVKNEYITANLNVTITPRISIALDGTDTVTMQISIDIQEFKRGTGSDNSRIMRNVTTNATVNTGDVLAIGGLIRTNNVELVNKFPILGDLPIIGWMFKNRSKVKQQTNLTVFISPTIIMPRLRDGMSEYTQDYMKIARNYAGSDAVFGGLKDPITRFFFNEKEGPVDKFSNRFIKKDDTQVKNYTPVKDSAPMPQDMPHNAASYKNKMNNDIKEAIKTSDNPFAKITAPPAV